MPYKESITLLHYYFLFCSSKEDVKLIIYLGSCEKKRIIILQVKEFVLIMYTKYLCISLSCIFVDDGRRDCKSDDCRFGCHVIRARELKY